MPDNDDPKAPARSIAAQLLGRKGGSARSPAQQAHRSELGKRSKGRERVPLPCRECAKVQVGASRNMTLCRDQWGRPVCENHGGKPKEIKP